MPQRPDHIQGLIFATLGALALTPDGLLVRLVEADDWTIVFWRGLIISLALFATQCFPLAQFKASDLLPQSKKEGAAAFLSAIGTLTFVLSIQHTSVANALVILSTMSLFAAIFSLIFLKEKIALRTWVAIAVAIGGIAVVFMEDVDAGGLNGKIYALICAFVTAGNMTLIRSDKTIKVSRAFAWGGLLICVPGVVFATSLVLAVKQAATLFIMGGLNAIAFVLLGAGAKRIPSPEVSLLMLLETILGPVWVWFILSETPSLYALIGGSIVVITLALHAYAGIRAQKKAP